MKKAKRHILSFIVLLLIISLPGVPAYSAVQVKGELITVEAEGFAPILNGAKNAAREEAKRSAYRDALEKALGAYVTGITEMQNYEVVKDKVFSQTTGIVKKIDIVTEKVGEDDILYITAICQVGQAALDGILGPAVLDALGNPRVMVLLDERIEDEPSFLSTAESEVLRVFEKAGYLLVDSGQSSLLKDIDLNAIHAKNDPEAYRQLARDFQADVLIYGKAYGSSFARQRIEGINIYGVRNTVQLRAVLSNTAYQLGSETFEEKSKGVSVEDGAIKGLKIAAAMASKSVVNKIAYALISGSAGGIPGRTVKVKISNVSFNEARDLKENLQGVSGVTGVYQRLFRDRKLELDVVSDKTAEDIASIISDLGFEINDLSSSLVEGTK
ncbi:MAG: flagellar assembly protein T N-terminal domain-containing protein [Synergistaceae bacterium]|nr:flagellar assembly protein T N-terminal domain-containing protein [Synergistaceae bacterium]